MTTKESGSGWTASQKRTSEDSPMPIVYCEQCGKKNRAPDSAIGKKGKCARCGAMLD